MRNVLTRFVCVFAATLLVNFEQSHAGIIVSNLSDAVNGEGTIYAPPALEPQEYAQEFTTGSQSVELGTVIAYLGAASGSFTASAELVADSSGLPGSTLLTSFSVPSIRTGTSLSRADLHTQHERVLLSANTNYWFVLAASGTGSYKWGYTDTLDTSLPNYAVSDDSGSTWTIGTPAGPFLIQVNSVTPSGRP